MHLTHVRPVEGAAAGGLRIRVAKTGDWGEPKGEEINMRSPRKTAGVLLFSSSVLILLSAWGSEASEKQ